MTAPAALRPAASSPAPELSVTGLRVAYDRDVEILRGVDVVAAARGITVVIGPNGAGKSTMLKAIAGLAPVTGGSVSLGGADILRLPSRDLLRRGLAFVPQEGTLFGQMTVRENLRLGGWLRRRERGWLARRVDEIASQFGMSGTMLARRAGDLSGGQQKLLEIARGLVLAPTVLLLDEPTAGLSPKLAAQVYDRVAALPRAAEVTILLVDQNVRAALEIATEVYVLAMGRNDARGTPADISARLGEITAGWMTEGASGAG